jgi:hypothetical protein
MGKKLIPEDKVDFLANVAMQHAVLDRPVAGKVKLSLILDLSSKCSKAMDTELARLPAGQWQADVPLTQQAAGRNTAQARRLPGCLRSRGWARYWARRDWQE